MQLVCLYYLFNQFEIKIYVYHILIYRVKDQQNCVTEINQQFFKILSIIPTKHGIYLTDPTSRGRQVDAPLYPTQMASLSSTLRLHLRAARYRLRFSFTYVPHVSRAATALHFLLPTAHSIRESARRPSCPPAAHRHPLYSQKTTHRRLQQRRVEQSSQPERPRATAANMTAHDQMRAMLDQLMGTGRNGESVYFAPHFVELGI